MDVFLPAALIVLQVAFIDLVLAGDNAIVVGMAAAGLPPAQRGKAIAVGIAAATLLRICFALAATALLNIIGLSLAGGLLLIWVCWRMWREMREAAPAGGPGFGASMRGPSTLGEAGHPASKTLRQAVAQIVVADVSMSLDNVLAVAGAVQGHPILLGIGLILSVAFMGLAATLVARVLARWHWINYLGLLIILSVALGMIYRGSLETVGSLAAWR